MSESCTISHTITILIEIVTQRSCEDRCDNTYPFSDWGTNLGYYKKVHTRVGSLARYVGIGSLPV